MDEETDWLRILVDFAHGHITNKYLLPVESLGSQGTFSEKGFTAVASRQISR